MTKTVWAILAAAGQGVRAGGELPKQFQLIAGKRVLDWSLDALLAISAIREVVVVLPSGHSEPSRPRVHYSVGSDARAGSVLAGLAALRELGAKPDDWVLVHDAARPCVPDNDILRLLEAVQTHSDGALLAMPVRDTLKRANRGSAEVQCTVARVDLWQALTPQCFPLQRLLTALEQASGQAVTDEAEAMERMGARPLLVQGSGVNIKLTYPNDYAVLAATLMGQQ